MFSQSVITNLSEAHSSANNRLFRPPGAESPEGDAQGMYEDPTHLIETDVDLSSIPFSMPQTVRLPVLGQPLRDIAEGLRNQLHAFVHANLSRPSRPGFTDKSHESPSVAELLQSCRAATEKLEQYFNDRGDGDMLSIQLRSAAHRMQSGLEGFLVAQLRSGITDSVSESDLEGVLHSCIELKGFLATNMQEMDALNIQVVAALAAQMQQEGMKRRSVKG